MKKYIIFDFDNTIVDSLDYWYQVMDIETFEHFGIPTIEDFRIQRRGMGNKEIAELFVRLAGVKESIDAVMNFWYSRMKIYYTEKVELIQGVRDWLKYLVDKGYRLILSSATNIDLLRYVIANIGIEQYFDEVYTEQTLGVSKKYSEYYTRLLSNIGANADEVFVFEDSVASITSAHSLGIDTCAILGKYNENRIDSLEKMSKMLIRDYTDNNIYQLGL